MKMDPCKMSGCASFSTPCLSIAEVEEKLEELDVYLTEVTLKLQLMKDRAEMEERTEALRQELSELRQQPPPLPPVRHDLFLIRAGVSSDAPASSTAPFDDGTPAALPTDERGFSHPDMPHEPEDSRGEPERRAQGLKTRRDVTRSDERTARVVTGGWRLRAKRPRRWSVLYRRPRRRRGDVVPLRKGMKGLLFRRRSERSRGSGGVDGHREASGLGLGRYPEGGARLKEVPSSASQTRDDAGSGPSGEEQSPSPTSFDAAAWSAFTEGSLVWAKLGNSKWWPGMLVDGGRGGMSGSGGRPWVFWFGDHRISEVSRDRVVEFSAGFASLLQPDYANKTYQLGLVEALRECRRQLGLDPLTGSLHQVIAWGRSAVTGDLTFRAVGVPAFVLSHLETIRKSQQRDAGTGRGDSESKTRPTEYPVPPRPDDVRGDWRRPVRLESVCLSCGCSQVVRPHPLFTGGLCRSCEHAVRDTMFAHAEDNISPYCVVCCQPGQLLICDEASCSRGYCYVCLRLLIGPDAPERLTSLNVWRCPMCHERNDVTLLKRRSDWRQQVVELFVPQSRPTQPPPADQFSERRPIRVLSLFDGIATGMHVLSQLGVEVDVYLASETDADAIHVAAMNYPRVQQLGPVETLTDARVGELAPVDLVLGGSPCTDLSVVNPARRGLYDPDGTGILFFDFYRVLRSVEVSNKGRHVFWLFENVASMPVEYRKVISRFLQTEPALIDAKHFTAQSRPRFFWGNIPGLYSPLPPHLLRSEHSIADCLLLPSRRPVTEQVGCVTTSRNSLRQGKMAVTPVTMDGEGDVMWITEIEQMFGLPRHYTDVGNIGPQKRQQLLGRAWSAPVIKHILNSLTSFFATTDADRE